jgi:hypothetical protein
MIMRWKRLLTFLVCGLLLGCAKFPPSSSTLDATRLTFVVNFAGPINPSYIYIVAIKVTNPAPNSNPLMTSLTNGPIPVTDVGSLNGMIGGWPTHYVVYAPNLTPNLYQVYRFPLSTSTTAPVNLSFPGVYVGDVLQSDLINPQNADGSYGQTLGFDIDTRFLDQYTTGPGAVQQIQVNILTANVAALSESDVNERVMDAIGNQSQLAEATFNFPVTINLNTGFTYVSGQGNMPVEAAGDTFPTGSNLPAVDMTSWSITVTPP